MQHGTMIVMLRSERRCEILFFLFLLYSLACANDCPLARPYRWQGGRVVYTHHTLHSPRPGEVLFTHHPISPPDAIRLTVMLMVRQMPPYRPATANTPTH